MLDLIFGVAGGITVYKILSDLGGLVLILFAVGGYAVVTWRRYSKRKGYRLQFAQLLFFAIALGLGISILVGWLSVG